MSNSFTFISYLLNDTETIDPDIKKHSDEITPGLLGYLTKMLRKQLRGCTGIVFDTDKNEEAKIRLFKMRAKSEGKSKLWEIDKIKYELPCTKPNEAGDTIKNQVALFYLRTENNDKYGSKLAPDYNETKDILGFIYNKLYADGYPDEPDVDLKYRAYLNIIYQRVLGSYSEKE